MREGRRNGGRKARTEVGSHKALLTGFFFPRFLKYNIAIYSQSESVGKRFSGREQMRGVCACVEGSMVRAVASLYTHAFGGWEQA